MTTLIIPLVLLALVGVLIIVLAIHEERKRPDKPPPLSEFEMYQQRARAARRRAEWRQRQRTIDNEREQL